MKMKMVTPGWGTRQVLSAGHQLSDTLDRDYPGRTWWRADEAPPRLSAPGKVKLSTKRRMLMRVHAALEDLCLPAEPNILGPTFGKVTLLL
jgi:hypothetical protein